MFVVTHVGSIFIKLAYKTIGNEIVLIKSNSLNLNLITKP